MTAIDEIKQMDTATITAEIASKVLRCNPNSIRQTAKLRPELLGFPVIRIGNETKIPRIPFLRYLGYE